MMLTPRNLGISRINRVMSPIFPDFGQSSLGGLGDVPATNPDLSYINNWDLFGSSAPDTTQSGVDLTTADSNSIANLIQQGLVVLNAEQLYQTNLSRAKNGLAPINAGAVTGLTVSTQTMVFALIALLGVAYFATKHK